MPINWPMPMGGNQGWGSSSPWRGGQGSQASWPQPAGDYQTSTAGGMKPPEDFGGQGFGDQPAMKNPDNTGFTPPSGGPASQWGGGGQVGYANPGQSAIYRAAMATRPDPTAGPMGMLGGMNTQQIQSILPMLRQLFAGRGAPALPSGVPGGNMYQGPVGGGMPPESSPVIPPGQGTANYTGLGDYGTPMPYQNTMNGGGGGQVGYANPGQQAILQQAMANPYRQAPMMSGQNGAPLSQSQIGYVTPGPYQNTKNQNQIGYQ